MSLNYSIAMMGNPLKKEEPKKAYAKAQTNGEINLKELSAQIASKCTVHRADVSAVLISTTECMLEGLKAGKQVNFGEMGAFRLQINSGGAPSADLFTADYIKGVNIQFIPGEDLQFIFQGMEFKLVATRAAQAAVIKAQKAGETTVDISGKNSASGSESPDEI
ncbi:MAG: DNA-binding protein [Parabacteroides sp.]|nr:DNA-binding protein [Parabacteroides sp.]